jgi:uncharacterized phage protein gp47/JayE
MAFDRKSMEQIVQSMTDWTKGVTTKLTDFRVGSRNRTLLEAVAKELEEYYDRVYRYIKTLVEENIYAVMGFPKRPATYSTGTVTFGRATAADSNYLIPIGTVVRTKATATSSPVSFRTTSDVLLAIGTMTIDAPVVALVAGVVGNAQVGTILDFQTNPSGVETVTNAFAYNNGQEEETADQQKNRFQKFVASLSRGTLPAIEYGATTAILYASDGVTIVERVVDAKAFEDLVNSLGIINVYVWNGTNTASSALLTEASKMIYGYYDANGKPVYGYKAAGIKVNVYSASAKPVTIKLAITPNDGVLLTDIQPYVEQEIGDFFAALKQGQTLLQTPLETRISLIQGVLDVKVTLSTDGINFSDSNIAAGTTEIITPQTPYQYI